MRTCPFIVAAAATLGITLSIAIPIQCAVAAEVTMAQIEAARTAADHEVIANEYEAQAREAEQKAVDHQAMAKAYGSKKGKISNQMALHCHRLVKQYQEAAKEYQALATEQRNLAKEAAQ